MNGFSEHFRVARDLSEHLALSFFLSHSWQMVIQFSYKGSCQEEAHGTWGLFTFNTSVQLKVHHQYPINNPDKEIVPNIEKLSYPIHNHSCQILIRNWVWILLISSSGLISLLSIVSGRLNCVRVRSIRFRITTFVSCVTSFLPLISKWRY